MAEAEHPTAAVGDAELLHQLPAVVEPHAAGEHLAAAEDKATFPDHNKREDLSPTLEC